MQKLDRDDIHILSRNSNWATAGVEQALRDNVYNDTAAWHRFLQLFFIGLGVCFTSAGIIFFFAYNWDDLGKFAKMALVGGSMLSVVLLVLLSKASDLIKNILLTGAAVLVGALFAVYGQIYQTGADTYELFIAWTAFVTLWVLAAGFAPLWLLYIALINTTVVLYLGQTANMQETTVCLLLFSLNSVFLTGALAIAHFKPDTKVPGWFTNILALVAVSIATFGIVVGIFDSRSLVFPLLLTTLIAYAVGVWYAVKTKTVFYFAILPFSVIIIISALMLKGNSTDTGMFLLVSLFIIGSVTLTIKNILNLQKKWADA